MNFFMHILSALFLIVLNNFSSKHSFIDSFGTVENHSNNSEKYLFISVVLIPIWVGRGNFNPLSPFFYWFSHNNSETFSNISLERFVPNSSLSPYIRQSQTREWGISDFRIFGQYLIKEDCHNSRTSNDICVKLQSLTERDKRNTTTSKKLDDNVISANYEVRFRKPDSRRSVCKSTFSLTKHLQKLKTELKKL